MSTTLNEQLLNVDSSNVHQLVTDVAEGLNGCFLTGFKLSTGLRMEDLWKLLRPMPIQNERVFEQLVDLENLATQFDQIKWMSMAVPADITKIMDSFIQAYRVVRLGEANIDGLVQSLHAEIEQMHTRYADDSVPSPPFLATEFEAIRKIITVVYMSNRGRCLPAVNDIVSLSDTSLVTLLRVNSATDTSQSLQMMETLVQDDQKNVSME